MSKGSGGGISGYTHSATISSCDVRTNITIDGASAVMSSVVGGGIVGKAFSSEISKCQVAGVISDEIGYACLGGLVGYSFSTRISESFNTAAISAKRASFGSPNGGDDDTNTGGLVGYTNSSELTDCYNSGTIMKSDQSENVGGIIGYLGVSYSFTSGKPIEMINISNIRNCYR